MKTLIGLCGFLILASTLQLGAREAITMSVYPTVSTAPATVIVRATVKTDAGNRALEIQVDSPNFYRSSRVQLDGDRAPNTSMFEFRSLPSGEYEVTVVLIGDHGRPRASLRRQLIVVSGRE